MPAARSEWLTASRPSPIRANAEADRAAAAGIDRRCSILSIAPAPFAFPDANFDGLDPDEASRTAIKTHSSEVADRSRGGAVGQAVRNNRPRNCQALKLSPHEQLVA